MAETPSSRSGNVIEQVPLAQRPRWPIAVAAAGLLVLLVGAIALRASRGRSSATDADDGATTAPPETPDAPSLEAQGSSPTTSAALQPPPATASAGADAAAEPGDHEAIAISTPANDQTDPDRPLPLKPPATRFMPLPPAGADEAAPAEHAAELDPQGL